MPDWISVVLLGLIEGITEFLPVSSTGHLLLVENTGLLPRQSDLFNVVIQCGAVLAVLVVFTRRLKEFWSRFSDRATQDYLLKLFAAFLITAIGGLLLKRAGLTLPKTVMPVAIATLVGGILILAVERALRQKPLRDEVSWSIAIAVGIAQLVAGVFPGTSRSGATILVALAMGLSRPAAAEFSFLLGIPTLLAAGALEIIKARHAEGPATDWTLLALGTATAAVSAFAVVKWLLRYIQTHTFVPFGWYRIALGLAIIILFLR